MIWDRREFISSTAFAGAALAVIPLAEGLDARADARQDTVKLEGRMTPYPATKYRPYVSKLAHSAQTTSWVQFDLGAATAVEGVRLYPNFNMEIRALGFPARMRIEGSNTPGFETVATLFDGSGADLPDPGDQIVFVATKAPQAASYRYVRLTASELRKIDGPEYGLSFAKVEVLSSGRDVAEGRTATADAELGNPQDRGFLRFGKRRLSQKTSRE